MVAAAVPLTAGCGSSDGATADPDTVAVVSDEPITVDEVRALARDDPLPPVRIAGGRYVDPMVIRAAFATAVTGGVGLAEDPLNGRWWLARVGAISFEPVNWDPETTFTIKSTMADRREQEHLSRLADGLRERWPVRLFEDRVAEVVDRKAPS